MPQDRGFSLIELVITTAITLAVVAGIAAMVNPAYGAFDTGLEMADMQQRVRVAVDALTRDLTLAGAGAYSGGRVGPLIQSFAPLLPFRRGDSGDPPGTFRTDLITIVSVPATAAQTSLAADFVWPDLVIQAAAGTDCTAGTVLCGFVPGMTILVFDAVGNVAAFTVAAVDDGAAQLGVAAWSAGSEHTTFRSGATIVEARIHTYYRKSDPSSQTFQLMHADGWTGPDVPVADHVVGLAFEYDGESLPPSLSASGDTSYGPAPPAPGTTLTAYPPGENCAFQTDEASGQPIPRLASLTPEAELVPLTPAQFTDGPWCPDESSAGRWDADLLRIRRVRVTLRVQAALAALRGPAGTLFTNSGTSRDANRWAPDQEIRFQVSPRNMNLEKP